jgi:hypothetical protein
MLSAAPAPAAHVRVGRSLPGFQVLLAAAAAAEEHPSRELLALHAGSLVHAALAALGASKSHAEFLANWSEVVNLCGADWGLAEAFFHNCWVHTEYVLMRYICLL